MATKKRKRPSKSPEKQTGTEWKPSIDELLRGVRNDDVTEALSSLIVRMRAECDLKLQRSFLGVEYSVEPVEPGDWPGILERATAQQAQTEMEPETARLAAALSDRSTRAMIPRRLAEDVEYEIRLHELQLRASDDMADRTLTATLLQLRIKG